MDYVSFWCFGIFKMCIWAIMRHKMFTYFWINTRGKGSSFLFPQNLEYQARTLLICHQSIQFVYFFKISNVKRPIFFKIATHIYLQDAFWEHVFLKISMCRQTLFAERLCLFKEHIVFVILQSLFVATKTINSLCWDSWCKCGHCTKGLKMPNIYSLKLLINFLVRRR